MAIFGISDLHLSLGQPFVPGEEPQIYKPMDVFGPHWQGHPVPMFEHWCRDIGPDDCVLVPGDLTWAMHYAEAEHDFAFLGQLPGQIYISKGNHDYWWDTKAKAQKALPTNVRALQNESVMVEDVLIAATRGWLCPGVKDFSEEDEKIYKRELIRLELALKSGDQLIKAGAEPAERWVMLHFRPVNDNHQKNEIIELLQAYNVNKCFYGHLHGEVFANVLEGNKWGIDFQLLSCDYLKFAPLKLR